MKIRFFTLLLTMPLALSNAYADDAASGSSIRLSGYGTAALTTTNTNAAKFARPNQATGVGTTARTGVEAGVTMGQIVESVKQVADIMAEISTASQEQGTGIREIGLAINHMDDMTQQNSALVEQATAAAESLEEQAVQLNAVLAVFKLAPTAHSAVQSAPAIRPLLR